MQPRSRQIDKSYVLLAVVGMLAGSSLLWAAQVRAQSLLGSIGAVLGAPLGGFLEAATTPTVRNIQGAANQVVDNLDSRVDSEISHAGNVVSSAINQANGVVAARLSDADNMMTARIAQVKTTGDELIDHAVGSVDIEQRRIFENANNLVKVINADGRNLLNQADQIIEKDLNQASGVLQNAIAQADHDVQARIEQVDEAATRQVGSVDAIATKQSLSLQVALLQVASLLGMIAFLVASLIYLYKNIPKNLVDLDHRNIRGMSRHLRVFGSSLGWVVAHVAAGAIGIAVFLLLANLLPQNAKKKVEALVQTHQDALTSSLQGLDFTMVKYHATILALLDSDPKNRAASRAVETRARVIRDVLTRPGMLGSADGVREISSEIQQAQQMQQIATPGSESPDLLTLAGHVRWQLAQTRSDELDAVSLCARALDVGKNDSQFVLGRLAVHYINAFLARPISWPMSRAHPYDAGALKALANAAPQGASSLSIGEDAQAYDDRVLELDGTSSTAFVALLQAQAAVEVAWRGLGKREPAPTISKKSVGLSTAQVAVQKALTDRQNAALALIKAWSDFDSALQHDERLARSPLAMAAFGLNDAPLAQAQWYQANPNTQQRAPKIVDAGDAVLRAKMVPIRVDWARRYLTPLRAGTKQLASYQESLRYLKNEAATLDFAKKLIDYRKALASAGDPADISAKRSSAAVAAASLGLYVGSSAGRIAYGIALLAEGSTAGVPTEATKTAVAKANDGVRLRLL